MDDDDELMGRLSRIAAEIDGPPPIVLEAARAAILTRRLDAQLAELVADSALVESAGLRSGLDEPRQLSFQLADGAIEIEVTVEEGEVTIRGLLTGVAGEIVIDLPRGTSVPVPVAPDGWFTASGLQPGPARIVVSPTEGAEIATPWMSL